MAPFKLAVPRVGASSSLELRHVTLDTNWMVAASLASLLEGAAMCAIQAQAATAHVLDFLVDECTRQALCSTLEASEVLNPCLTLPARIAPTTGEDFEPVLALRPFFGFTQPPFNLSSGLRCAH